MGESLSPHPTPTSDQWANGLQGKDTKTLIGYLKVPQINPQVISRHVGLVVAVDRDGVDVVCVRIGKHSSWGGLHHQVHGSQDGHLGYERGTVLRTESFQ